ncbi:long-chain fatty acid--CoA ligase [Taibaiella sp. KBW10]|uniref:AMP-dependent synthetase/ligase n=1 Tax=Taibaiella sp. KBW10 TaxID=2153357 RepID=UPI000F5A9458|nr:long-chain fatty acid--CoA ligase [Taibaiella sp. KBW10]RQO32586.1 long-chain fatty acid--CoA ligase [Taibaiella sp. KBW10]
MNIPSRLFDCMPLQAAAPIPDLLAGKMAGKYVPLSTEAVHTEIKKLAAGLIAKGISAHDMSTEGRDKIAILSNSRPEWLITDLAVQLTGAILVPLYPNITLSEMTGIFNESGVKGCFVHSPALYRQIMAHKELMPELEWVYTFEQEEGVPYWESCKIQQPLPEQLQVMDTIKERTVESDIATIIYTSGTTGTPKGVMLSHKNVVSNVNNVHPIIDGIGLKERKALSFLPLNHILEKMISYVYLFNGFSIYYAESMDTIGDNLKEVQPSIFVTVPRLLEKVYEKIMATGHQLTGIKKKLFFWAVELGRQYEPGQSRSWWYRFKLAIANKLIFSKWRAALGGQVKAIVVGGAPCQPRLVKIFSAAKVVIMEGYGLTESSPVIAVNHYDEANRRAGTVGPVIDQVQVRIADDGEILCKGDNIMVGYYKKPEATAAAFVDGWFETGDIGELIEGRFLKITDRKKELFKTSGGKYVAPQPIESKLKESRFIEQVMLIGESRKFVSALIVPSFSNLELWMKEQHIPFESQEQAVKHPQVIKSFYELVNGYNANFSHIEQIKKFVLLPQEWGIETGELTPKLSLKRKVILQKYAVQIDQMYEGAETDRP